jgi:hypothetical protein
MVNQILGKPKSKIQINSNPSLEVNQETHKFETQILSHEFIGHPSEHFNQISSNLEIPRRILSNFIEFQTLEDSLNFNSKSILNLRKFLQEKLFL